MYDKLNLDELVASHQVGWALDQRFYVDPEIYQLELDRIVMRNWILAGHVSQIPDGGDYLVFRLANESAIARGPIGFAQALGRAIRSAR